MLDLIEHTQQDTELTCEPEATAYRLPVLRRLNLPVLVAMAFRWLSNSRLWRIKTRRPECTAVKDG